MAAPGSSLSRLVEIMDRLLAPDGCPWDREQTLASLRPFLVEETYEVLDALERDHVEDHREELGDLLMQVVFQAALRQAEGAFGIDDVVAEICDKLVRRHPHVFGAPGASDARTSAEVLTQWEQIKAGEKAKKAAAAARTLGGVLPGLPALARAQKLGDKAGRVGFDWGGWQGSLAKVREEVDEVTEVADRRAPPPTTRSAICCSRWSTWPASSRSTPSRRSTTRRCVSPGASSSSRTASARPAAARPTRTSRRWTRCGTPRRPPASASAAERDVQVF
jgi:MazG family protein